MVELKVLWRVASQNIWLNWKRRKIGRFIQNQSWVLGIVILAIILGFAFVLPLFVPTDPLGQNLPNRLRPPIWLAKGTPEHPLGTDQLGRDILSRLMMGTRISLTIGVGGVLLSALFGVMMGTISGYLGGRTDMVIQRVVELQMAFPFIVIALIVMAFLQATPGRLIVVFGFTGWVIYARIIRGVALTVRQREFVEAAVGTGGSHLHIMRRHILPNIINTAIVLATLELSVLIYAEAALSFLGIGIQPPTPSLGVMLGEGRVYLSNAWWLATLPGLVLMVLILGVNFLGDGLREVLDPTLSTSRLNVGG